MLGRFGSVAPGNGSTFLRAGLMMEVSCFTFWKDSILSSVVERKVFRKGDFVFRSFRGSRDLQLRTNGLFDERFERCDDSDKLCLRYSDSWMARFWKKKDRCKKRSMKGLSMDISALSSPVSGLEYEERLVDNVELYNDREELNQCEALSPSCYKWRMIISYDGTKFSGWQYQPTTPTIQSITEKALIKVTKLDRKEICLVGASRTDTGVHAYGQVAHFVTPFCYDNLENVHAAINGLLPSEIRVREISPTKLEFHARFSTRSKTYHYKIYNHPTMDPFQRLYAYHSSYKLNACAMREAAQYFIGKHDFSAFANASHNDGLPNPVKEIFRFDIVEMGYLLQIEVEGSGFLYRQVRNMVALLIQIGREALPPDIVSQIIATRDRKELANFSLSAPPHGLCLMSVNYCPEILQPPAGYPAITYGREHTLSKCKLPYY